MYQICVKWCKDERITSISDLQYRVIEHSDYEILWYKRCEKMQYDIKQRRKNEYYQ